MDIDISVVEASYWEGKDVESGETIRGSLRIENDKAYILEPDYSVIVTPPEQPLGFNCGVEDRGYQNDGYAAANYGWEDAIERYIECLPVWQEVFPESLKKVKLMPKVEIRGTHPPRPVYFCPVCKKKTGHHHKHCLNCGSALHWK